MAVSLPMIRKDSEPAIGGLLYESKASAHLIAEFEKRRIKVLAPRRKFSSTTENPAHRSISS